jgi:hypothetical protein
MARQLSYIFPIANNLDVCALQNTGEAANLVLNGNLSNQVINQVSFIDYGYSRSISLTSTNNLTAINFTINGIQNGRLISEVLAGPNANTVYSLQIYDKIYSIATNGAVNQVRAGTGFLGFFPLININIEKGLTNFALSTAKLTPGTYTTTIYNTLQNIVNNGRTFLNNTPANNFNVFEIKASNPDAQFFLPAVFCLSILVQINGNAGQIANSIEMNFIET